eukprot:1144845-Pelagomonas_calceolata.AAC.2
MPLPTARHIAVILFYLEHAPGGLNAPSALLSAGVVRGLAVALPRFGPIPDAHELRAAVLLCASGSPEVSKLLCCSVCMTASPQSPVAVFQHHHHAHHTAHTTASPSQLQHHYGAWQPSISTPLFYVGLNHCRHNRGVLLITGVLQKSGRPESLVFLAKLPFRGGARRALPQGASPMVWEFPTSTHTRPLWPTHTTSGSEIWDAPRKIPKNLQVALSCSVEIGTGCTQWPTRGFDQAQERRPGHLSSSSPLCWLCCYIAAAPARACVRGGPGKKFQVLAVTCCAASKKRKLRDSVFGGRSN